MGYATLLAIFVLLCCWIAVYVSGTAIRAQIRSKAPALELEVFPPRALWVLNAFPPWSPFSIIASSPLVCKRLPELAAQFTRFKVYVYFWFGALVAVLVTVSLGVAGYGS